MKKLTQNFIPVVLVAILILNTVTLLRQQSFVREMNNISELGQRLASLKDDLSKQQNTTSDDITKGLATLREELIKYRAEQVGRDQILGLATGGRIEYDDAYSNLSTTLDQTISSIDRKLGITPTPAPKTVSLQPSWNKVEVYELPKASSKILGEITSSSTYPILATQANWYQIKLPDDQTAWVQSQFVYESN